MRIEEALKIGLSSRLSTVGEAVLNIQMHSMSLFSEPAKEVDELFRDAERLYRDTAFTTESGIQTVIVYLENPFGLDLRTCDAETACFAAEAENLSEADRKALLEREDADKDYGDIYFFAMLPYSTIREAVEYHRLPEDMRDNW